MKNSFLLLVVMLFLSVAAMTAGSCAGRHFFKPVNARLAPYNGTVIVLDAFPDSTTFLEVGSFYDGRVAVKKVGRTFEIAKRISAENGADALVVLENRKKEGMDLIYYPIDDDGNFIMIPMYDTYVVFRAKAIKMTGR